MPCRWRCGLTTTSSFPFAPPAAKQMGFGQRGRRVQITAGQRCAADGERGVRVRELRPRSMMCGGSRPQRPHGSTGEAGRRFADPPRVADLGPATVAAPSILGGGQHSKHFRKHTGDKGGRSLNNLPIRLMPHRPQATCRSNCRRPHPRLKAVPYSGPARQAPITRPPGDRSSGAAAKRGDTRNLSKPRHRRAVMIGAGIPASAIEQTYGLPPSTHRRPV
jgi:hypothetical protein